MKDDIIAQANNYEMNAEEINHHKPRQTFSTKSWSLFVSREHVTTQENITTQQAQIQYQKVPGQQDTEFAHTSLLKRAYAL